MHKNAFKKRVRNQASKLQECIQIRRSDSKQARASKRKKGNKEGSNMIIKQVEIMHPAKKARKQPSKMQECLQPRKLEGKQGICWNSCKQESKKEAGWLQLCVQQKASK